jgi:hypothetical protein
LQKKKKASSMVFIYYISYVIQHFKIGFVISLVFVCCGLRVTRGLQEDSIYFNRGQSGKDYKKYGVNVLTKNALFDFLFKRLH